MILSQTATYALRAMLCLADARDSGPLRVDDIATRLDVPRNYLSKILHVLARAQILKSTRGPGGGFRLAQDPATLKLSEIIGHFDNLPQDSGCLLGRGRCSDSDPCPAHGRWKSVSVLVRDFFNDTTLADLSNSDVPGATPDPPLTDGIDPQHAPTGDPMDERPNEESGIPGEGSRHESGPRRAGTQPERDAPPGDMVDPCTVGSVE